MVAMDTSIMECCVMDIEAATKIAVKEKKPLKIGLLGSIRGLFQKLFIFSI